MSTAAADHPLPRHLDAIAAATDLAQLRVALLAVDDPQRASVHRFLAERSGTPVPGGGRHPLPALARYGSALDGLLAVTVLAPAQAARVMEYRPWSWQPDHVEELVRVVGGRGPQWAGRFLGAVGKRRISGRRGDDPATFARVVDALCDRFSLPRPVGHRDYVQGWVARQPPGDGPRVAWRTDPCVPAILPAALGTFGIHRVPDLPGALAGLVEDGVLTRAELVRVLLDHLLAPGRPATQRTQLEALQGLSLTSGDLGGFPVALTLVATCHGRVAVPLLPLAVELADGEEDLVALAAGVAGRPEQGLRADLVAALTSDHLVDRLGRPAVVAALRALREGESDAAFAASVDRVLRRLGAAEASPAQARARSGLWELAPEPAPAPTAATRPDARSDAAQLVRAVRDGLRDPDVGHREDWHPPRTAVDDALALLVRWGYVAGANAVRTALRPELGDRGDPSPLWIALRQWTAGGLDEHVFTRWVHAMAGPDEGRTTGWLAHTLAERGWGALRLLLAGETLVRLGREVPVLLSAPEPDGAIAFDLLAERLRASDGAAYGPLDLLTALLRLEPVDPSRLVELPRSVLAADPRVTAGSDPGEMPHAVEVVEDWVRRGGLRAHLELRPDHHPDPRTDAWQTTELQLPPLAGRLPTVPPRLLLTGPSGRSWGNGVLACLPWAPDLAFSLGRFSYLRREDRDPGFLGWVHDVPGRPGVVTLDHLLGLMEGSDARTRDVGAGHALRLLAADRVDASALAAAARIRLGRGELALTRFSRTWEQVALDGGLRGTWAAVLDLAAAAAARSPRPQGLADLLRCLAGLAHEVPEPVLPQPLLDLAASRGSTKAHQEARALVAACTVGPA